MAPVSLVVARVGGSIAHISRRDGDDGSDLSTGLQVLIVLAVLMILVFFPCILPCIIWRCRKRRLAKEGRASDMPWTSAVAARRQSRAKTQQKRGILRLTQVARPARRGGAGSAQAASASAQTASVSAQTAPASAQAAPARVQTTTRAQRARARAQSRQTQRSWPRSSPTAPVHDAEPLPPHLDPQQRDRLLSAHRRARTGFERGIFPRDFASQPVHQTLGQTTDSMAEGRSSADNTLSLSSDPSSLWLQGIDFDRLFAGLSLQQPRSVVTTPRVSSNINEPTAAWRDSGRLESGMQQEDNGELPPYTRYQSNPPPPYTRQ